MNSSLHAAMHLSGEQIEDHLIGDLAPEAAAHLKACELCLARVTEAEAPLASFRAVSLAWSERRSATLPLQSSAASRPNWTRRLVWGCAAAAALVVGLTIPRHTAGTEDRAQPPVAAAAPVPGTGASPDAANEQKEQQIAQDNQLLAAVDRELDASLATPTTFGLEAGGSRSRNRTRTSAQD